MRLYPSKISKITTPFSNHSCRLLLHTVVLRRIQTLHDWKLIISTSEIPKIPTPFSNHPNHTNRTCPSATPHSCSQKDESSLSEDATLSWSTSCSRDLTRLNGCSRISFIKSSVVAISQKYFEQTRFRAKVEACDCKQWCCLNAVCTLLECADLYWSEKEQRWSKIVKRFSGVAPCLCDWQQVELPWHDLHSLTGLARL